MGKPFIKRHENNTAYMTIAAENYLRFGYMEYGFAPIMHTDPIVSSPNHFYLNHPPLGNILASISIILISITEVSSRIIPIFLTMIGMSAFALWIRRIYGIQVAIIAAALFATFPMIAYYGQMLNHEPLIVAFALMLLPLLDLYQSHRKHFHLLLIVILTILMCLSGWQALFFAGIYGIYALYLRSWKLLITIGLASIAGILLWTLPLIIIFPDFLDRLQNQFLIRSGIEEQLWQNPIDFIWQIAWARWRPRYTESIALLTPLGMFLFLTPTYHKQTHRRLLAVLLIIPALLQVVVFQQQTFTHDYTLYYFAPFLALMSAIALHWLWQKIIDTTSMAKITSIVITGLLILAFILSSFRWTRNLYTEKNTFPIDVAPVIQAQTQAGDIIYSNAIGWSTATWYYSERDYRDIINAPDSDYTALICLPDESIDTFPAGNLFCKIEYR